MPADTPAVRRSQRRAVFRAGAWLAVLAAVQVSCGRDRAGTDIGVLPPEDLENWLSLNAQLDYQDAGYGASVLLDDAEGRKGAVAFQAVEGGETSLRLLGWDTDANTVSETEIAVNVGTIFKMRRAADGDSRVIVGASLAAGGTASLTIWTEGSGGGWTQHVIDQSEDNARFLDAEIDANGAVHVMYVGGGNRDLRYVVWQDGVLLTQPRQFVVVDTGVEGSDIDPGGTIDSAVSLVLTAAGEPIVAYHDGGRGQLRVATRDATTFEWSTRVVGYAVKLAVLAVGSDGTAQIADRIVPRKSQLTLYKNAEPLDDSAYTILSDSSIRVETPEAGVEYQLDYITPISTDYGNWSDMELAQSGAVGLALYDRRGGRLLYAANSDVASGADWSIELVDESGIVGSSHDLVLLPLLENGVQRGEMPVIVYHDVGNSDLLMTFRKGATWERKQLATVGLTGLEPSAVKTDSGWVVVAYHEVRPQTYTANLQLLRALPVR